MNDILVPLDPADLIDRIIALQLRVEQARDAGHRGALQGQRDVLTRLASRLMPEDALMAGLTAQLGAARSDLAHLVQDLRDCEGRKDYGIAFIALSQSMLGALSAVDDTKAAINRHFAETVG